MAVTRVSVRTRLLALVRAELPMPLAERARWAGARSLAERGELMAAWLAGEVECRPGYDGWADVDEDLAPGLTETLVVLNRAGFLTDSSQGGYVGPAYQQCAAVEGFMHAFTYERIRAELCGTRFEHFAWPLRLPWRRRYRGLPVSWLDGAPYVEFGTQLGVRDLAWLFRPCSASALADLSMAWQVTIFDPRPGRNDLWPLLRAAAAELTGGGGRG